MIQIKKHSGNILSNRHRRVMLHLSRASRRSDESCRIQRTVHNQKQFKLVLEHERRKQNHLNRQFSLILIHIDRGTDYLHCIETITGHVRETDIIGMHDKTHVGIILPETSVNGAWVVENRLSALLDSHNVIAGLKINTLMYSEVHYAYTYQPLNTTYLVV